MSFHQPEWRISLKKTFPLDGKITGRSLWKVEGEKWFPLVRKSQLSLARLSSFFENCLLLIPIMLSTSSNKALTKKILFPLSRNPFALAGWRILENRFPQQDYGSSLKKDFPTNKKHVSTCWNDGLTKKCDPFDGKIAFTGTVDCYIRKWKKMFSTGHRSSLH